MTRRERIEKIREAMDVGAAALDDAAALTAIPLFRFWNPGETYFAGDMRQHEGYLYRARQSHTSQDIYPPPLVPSLWERISEQGQGTHDNPIPYDASVGMALENGKFYTEDNVLYECFRDTGIPVYQPLSALVDIYVRVSN